MRDGEDQDEDAEDDDDLTGAELESMDTSDGSNEGDLDPIVEQTTNKRPSLPLDYDTKLLLRRRNQYMGLISAGLSHGNNHRLLMHRLDRKIVREHHKYSSDLEGKKV